MTTVDTPGEVPNYLADRVRRERLRRNWSARQAATVGGISNTWWSKFEDGKQPLTDKIREAVVNAFGWEAHWPSQPDEFVELQDRVERLRMVVVRLAELAGFDAGPLLDGPLAQSQADQ